MRQPRSLPRQHPTTLICSLCAPSRHPTTIICSLPAGQSLLRPQVLASQVLQMRHLWGRIAKAEMAGL